MHKSRLAVMVLAFPAFTLTACANHAQQQADMAEKRAGYQKMVRLEVQGRAEQATPPDYVAKIDAYLAFSLKDPDSRKVLYRTTNGGFVCGAVNAKNSCGGYTGPQPFAAEFKMDGQLELLMIFTQDMLNMGDYLPREAEILARGCGYAGLS